MRIRESRSSTYRVGAMMSVLVAKRVRHVLIAIIGISAILSIATAAHRTADEEIDNNVLDDDQQPSTDSPNVDLTPETTTHPAVLNISHEDVSGRMLHFMGMGRQQNQQFQECTTPRGSRGHCKFVQDCQFPGDQQPNLIQMIGYMCVIQRFSIGVCCPDAPDAAEKSSAPFTFDRIDDNDEPPVWAASASINGNPPAPPPQSSSSPTQFQATPQRPEDRGCGIATRSFPKITGGRPADPGEWPWMAALLRRGQANKAFCGGVLVTDRHVMTAAHCLRRFRATEVFVRLGEYDFADFNETRARDFRCSDIRQHPDFDENTYEHDIALLKLDRPAMFTSYVWPVCMPPVGQSWEGYQAVVTGWGTQFFGGPPSEVLMEVALPVWTRQRCQEAFAQRIGEGVMCAGATEGGRDSCQGDSGGPLLVQLPNRRWTVVGIVSWGVRCGEPNFPGIYTKVDAYAGWILENAVF